MSGLSLNHRAALRSGSDTCNFTDEYKHHSRHAFIWRTLSNSSRATAEAAELIATPAAVITSSTLAPRQFSLLTNSAQKIAPPSPRPQIPIWSRTRPAPESSDYAALQRAATTQHRPAPNALLGIRRPSYDSNCGAACAHSAALSPMTRSTRTSAMPVKYLR